MARSPSSLTVQAATASLPLKTTEARAPLEVDAIIPLTEEDHVDAEDTPTPTAPRPSNIVGTTTTAPIIIAQVIITPITMDALTTGLLDKTIDAQTTAALHTKDQGLLLAAIIAATAITTAAGITIAVGMTTAITDVGMTHTTSMTEIIRAIAATAEAAVAVTSEAAAVAAVISDALALALTTETATLRLTKAETLDKCLTGPSPNSITRSLMKLLAKR